MTEPTPPRSPDRQPPPGGEARPADGPRSEPGSRVGALAEWIARALVVGPDPPDRTGRPTGPLHAGRPAGPLAWLLPWWVRWLLVVAAAVVGGFWSSAGIGEQVAWGLDYAALIGVSLAASYWRPIFLINLALSAVWFL